MLSLGLASHGKAVAVVCVRSGYGCYGLAVKVGRGLECLVWACCGTSAMAWVASVGQSRYAKACRDAVRIVKECFGQAVTAS